MCKRDKGNYAYITDFGMKLRSKRRRMWARFWRVIMKKLGGHDRKGKGKEKQIYPNL